MSWSDLAKVLVAVGFMVFCFGVLPSLLGTPR